MAFVDVLLDPAAGHRLLPSTSASVQLQREAEKRVAAASMRAAMAEDAAVAAQAAAEAAITAQVKLQPPTNVQASSALVPRGGDLTAFRTVKATITWDAAVVSNCVIEHHTLCCKLGGQLVVELHPDATATSFDVASLAPGVEYSFELKVNLTNGFTRRAEPPLISLKMKTPPHRMLSTSSYKKLYDLEKSQIPKTMNLTTEVKLHANMLEAATKLVRAFAVEKEQELGVAATTVAGQSIGERAGDLVRRLEDISLRSTTAVLKAIRLWTSSKGNGDYLEVTAGWKVELCTMINAAISGDTATLMVDAVAAAAARPALQNATAFAAITNSFLTSSSSDTASVPHLVQDDAAWQTKLPWEHNFICYRGTSIPVGHLTGADSIITVGSEYRAAIFLATSFSCATSIDFAVSAGTSAIADSSGPHGVCGPRVQVLFEIECPSTRCMHANYIASGLSEVAGEAELLFSPYSAFTVMEVPDFSQPPSPLPAGYPPLPLMGATGLPVPAPYLVKLRAFADNRPDRLSAASSAHGASDDLRVATWH